MHSVQLAPVSHSISGQDVKLGGWRPALVALKNVPSTNRENQDWTDVIVTLQLVRGLGRDDVVRDCERVHLAIAGHIRRRMAAAHRKR